MSSFSTDKLLLCAGEGLHALSEELKELRQREYPGDASRELIELFDHIGSRLRGQLVTLKDDAYNDELESNPVVSEYLAVVISRLALLVTYLYQWLEVIEMSSKEYGLREMAVPLEEIVEGVDKGCRILTSPVYDENYSFVDVIAQLRKRLSSALGHGEVSSLLAECPSHVASVTFPRAARGNVLQHTLIGHEIGHLVDSVHRISHDASESCAIPVLIRQAIDAWVEEPPSSESQEAFDAIGYKSRLSKAVTTLLETWSGELVADLYALQLWGFASFCAMADFLFTRSMGPAGTQGSLDLWTDRHPSPRFRLGLILDEIERMNTLQEIGLDEGHLIEQEIKGFKQLVASKPGKFNDMGEGLEGYLMVLDSPEAFTLAREVLDGAKDKLRDDILRRLARSECIGVSTNYAEAAQMADRLARQIPPCEIVEGEVNKPVGMGEILNGGWLYRVTHPVLPRGWSGAREIDDAFEERIRGQDALVRRGIDLSQMFATYLARRDEVERTDSP